MTDDLKNKQNELVQECVNKLSEYFDSVQIICTAHDDNGDGSTWVRCKGHGNYYSRVAVCREFVLKADEQSREEVRREFEG
jgi:hypothetical protein